jgi:hypothetical protein
MVDVTPGAVTGWLAHRLPVDDDHRAEVTESVASVVSGRPRCERAWEAASLVGLWLRLWGRREGGDDARRALRQGVYLGGVILAFAAATEAWRQTRHLDDTGAAALGLALAAAAVGAGGAALAAGGWRGAAILVCAAALAVGVVAEGSPATAGIVAPLALVAGDRFGAHRCWRGLAGGALAAGLLAAAAAYAPAGPVSDGSAAALVTLPLAFLVVGWFDPRFAVAATTVWLGAFVTLDAGLWLHAVSAGARTPEVARWAAMSAAVLIAANVSRAALRRAFAN